MLIQIDHSTRYVYDRPVFVEPMLLRLRPCENALQRLREHRLQFDPQPAGTTETTDLQGNPAVFLRFADLLSSVFITTQSLVETLRENTYDFVVYPTTQGELADYSGEDPLLLEPYLKPRTERGGRCERFAAERDELAKGDLVRFLVDLTSELYDRYALIVRPEGSPWTADETLAVDEASCRDLAVLFAEICRAAGVAARFVSGYAIDSPEGSDQHLHAWTEAYIPGAGWRGFDPSLGLAVADRHVVAATAASPQGASPTAGAFRGTGATAVLDTVVAVREVSAPLTQSQSC